MTIGILTYQNTVNFGAALQCYALQEACKDLGAEAEVINYRSERMTSAKREALRRQRAGWMGSLYRSLQRPFSHLKADAFRRFSNKHLQLGSREYVNAGEIADDFPDYRMVLIGSDQVWNYQINGMDEAFFGSFAPSTTRIASYASSFGLESVPDSLIETYKEGLGRIDPISVRENLGADIVWSLLGKRAKVVPDPVLLRPAEQWRKLARTKKSTAVAGGLVTYFLGGHTGARAESIIESSHLRTHSRVKLAGGLSVSDLLSRTTSVRLDRGPVDFVQVIDSASFVLTDSFHATLMSIILDRPFGVILKGDTGKDARVLDALSMFGLSERAVTSVGDLDVRRPSEQSPTKTLMTQVQSDGLDYLRSVVCS